MQTKKINQILFNPFVKIAGLKALLLGLIVVVIASILAYWADIRFNGVLDVHASMNLKTNQYIYFLLDGLNAWLSVVVIFYPICLFVTKFKVRFIDVLGTFLFARLPMVFDALIIMYFKSNPVNQFILSIVQKTQVNNTIQVTDWIFFFLSIVLIILCSVWFVALNFNAFKVNSNLKGGKLVWTFVVGLLLAETLSLIVFANINNTSIIPGLPTHQ